MTFLDVATLALIAIVIIAIIFDISAIVVFVLPPQITWQLVNLISFGPDEHCAFVDFAKSPAVLRNISQGSWYMCDV
jgi:hypothetical protein